MYQGITPEENREFASTIGNWTGAVTWEAGPLFGRSGLAKITIPALQSPKYIYLSYPYFKPLRNKYNLFSVYTLRRNLIPSIQSMKITLTDTIYTLTSPLILLTQNDVWIQKGYEPFIPSDWIINQSQLSIEFSFGDVMESYLHLDSASLTAQTGKKQYLPLLGVG